MKCVRPKRYPHWGRYAYSQWGFLHRLAPRLLAEGFTPKQVMRLEGLYFGHDHMSHIDDCGTYRNRPRYRLYYLSRKLKGDRKSCLFRLVARSCLFYCYYDDEGEMLGFASPRIFAQRGLMAW